jgi:hypothetical protein
LALDQDQTVEVVHQAAIQFLVQSQLLVVEEALEILQTQETEEAVVADSL